MPTVSPTSIRKSRRTPKAPTRLGDNESLTSSTRLEPELVTTPVLPTPTRLEPASTPVHVLMVDSDPPLDLGTLSYASLEPTCET